MSLSCPYCKSLEVEPLAGVFESAQTEGLVRRAAPPKKASCLFIIQIWFLVTMTMDLTTQFLRWTETVRGSVLLGVFTVSAFAVAGAWGYNRYQWPASYEKWQHSYLCITCDKIFEGRLMDNQ